MNFTFCPSCGQKGTVKQLDKTAYQCTSCGWQHWNNAKAAVAVAFIKEGKVLVSKRGREPQKGKYDLPGGFVDFGEDAYACAVREIAEETSVHVERKDLILCELYTHNYIPGIFTIDIVFVVKKWRGEFAAADDSAGLEWKPYSFINDPAFCPAYSDLDILLAGKFGGQA